MVCSTTLRKTRSKSGLGSSAPTSRAMSINRFDCSGSSWGGFGLRGMAPMIPDSAHSAPFVEQPHLCGKLLAQRRKTALMVLCHRRKVAAMFDESRGVRQSHADCLVSSLIRNARNLAGNGWSTARSTLLLCLRYLGHSVEDRQGLLCIFSEYICVTVGVLHICRNTLPQSGIYNCNMGEDAQRCVQHIFGCRSNAAAHRAYRSRNQQRSERCDG